MNYIEVCFVPFLKDESLWVIDIFKDELLTIGFESFVDNDTDFKGYINEINFTEEALYELTERFCKQYQQNVAAIDCNIKTIKQQNWNAIWESEYESVVFGDFCAVRPPFNKREENVRHDIVIEPKMSFGTAHHPTTALMIMFLEKERDTDGKRLMDMGCGTSVLAILAKKIGFGSVVAVDNDSCTVKNAIENAKNNNVDIEILLLENYTSKANDFDVFLANINRNTLLENLEVYSQSIKLGGKLVLSGFYKEDCDMLIEAAAACKLQFRDLNTNNGWAVLVFEKN